MKKILLIITLSISLSSVSQEIIAQTETPKVEIAPIPASECQYFLNFTNEKETYKATKLSVVYMRNFAGNDDRIYFALAKTNGIPSLNVEFAYRGRDPEFGEGKCFDKNSQVMFTLKNGTTVTLLHIDREDCFKTEDLDSKTQIRTLSASFRFLMGNMEALKNSPVKSMRVTYAHDVQDYVFQKDINLESENILFEPENYFIKFMNCIDN